MAAREADCVRRWLKLVMLMDGSIAGGEKGRFRARRLFVRSSDARRISCLDLKKLVGTVFHAAFRNSGRVGWTEAIE